MSLWSRRLLLVSRDYLGLAAPSTRSLSNKYVYRILCSFSMSEASTMFLCPTLANKIFILKHLSTLSLTFSLTQILNSHVTHNLVTSLCASVCLGIVFKKILVYRLLKYKITSCLESRCYQ